MIQQHNGELVTSEAGEAEADKECVVSRMAVIFLNGSSQWEDSNTVFV